MEGLDLDGANLRGLCESIPIEGSWGSMGGEHSRPEKGFYEGLLISQLLEISHGRKLFELRLLLIFSQ